MVSYYTATVKDGISFRDFVMRCARSFFPSLGDEEIPEVFVPDECYRVRVDDAYAKLDQARKIDLATARVLALKEFDDLMSVYEKRVADSAEASLKFTDMLEKVHTWQAPTDDHRMLRQFMIEQLVKSIGIERETLDYCIKPVLKTPEEWLEVHVRKCAVDLNCANENWIKEVRKYDEWTNWFKALKASLDSFEKKNSTK